MIKLTLISHHLCPYVQRAAITLLEKGVPFERINIDLADKPDWFLKISPLGKVPLLRIQEDDGGEEVLFESSVICEYLEETQAGTALHPTDALTRARHRGWMEFGSSVLSDLWGYETAQDAAQLEVKHKALVAKFTTIEGALTDDLEVLAALADVGRHGDDLLAGLVGDPADGHGRVEAPAVGEDDAVRH